LDICIDLLYGHDPHGHTQAKKSKSPPDMLEALRVRRVVFSHGLTWMNTDWIGLDCGQKADLGYYSPPPWPSPVEGEGKIE